MGASLGRRKDDMNRHEEILERLDQVELRFLQSLWQLEAQIEELARKLPENSNFIDETQVSRRK